MKTPKSHKARFETRLRLSILYDANMQGVVKSYDPTTGDGVIVCDADLKEYELSPDALEGSLFRMLRQGQRIVFSVDDHSFATQLRLGSEVDMGTPDFLR